MPHFGYSEPVPLFPLHVGRGETGISRISIGNPLDGSGWIRDDRDPLIREALSQLAAYFAGKCRSFDLPLEVEGTRFQLDVWKALLKIPYGQIRTYGELAREFGRPTLARAIGGANHANPIPIIIPCHRVIATGGELGGYVSGLDRKRYLLELEDALSAIAMSAPA